MLLIYGLLGKRRYSYNSCYRVNVFFVGVASALKDSITVKHS